MAGGGNRKISAASARGRTRRSKQNSYLNLLPSGIFKKILCVFFVGILGWTYQAIFQPPPPKTLGSPDGLLITAPRTKLRDGRHLAYTEHGVSKDVARFKIIFVHGFDNSMYDSALAIHLSPEVIEELGVCIVSFDRPGYGESDPHPERTLKSLALDIEELADQLGLGSKFYVIGKSMGGELTWSCLKYIPHRLAGVALIAPVVNYWWPGFPTNLSREAYYQQLPQDQRTFGVAHYAPWLTYWWNTQKWFPASSAATRNPDAYSHQDKEIIAKFAKEQTKLGYSRQQGEYESVHRDLNIAFGNWEFDPMHLENPFPNNEGSVHIWQGDEDRLVPVILQRYIAHELPWIHYHELPGSGHAFAYLDGMADAIVKALLIRES